MPDRMIVFDMDGVLVDVGESYRASIVETVKHLTGQTITRDQIQDYKNHGGWNNDWALTQKICEDLGVPISYETAVFEFNKIFFGPSGRGEDGLMARERWIPQPGLLERIQAQFDFGIFTGRVRYELDLTLERCAPHLRFGAIMTADSVEHQKPHPDGLLKIAALDRERPLLYIGDTVDDARAARAAQVPFIGIAAPHHGAALPGLLRAEGARHVLENINQLETVL